jgi:acetolactate synthase-1/2/3 large subunit
MIDPTGTAEPSTGATDADETTADDATPINERDGNPPPPGELSAPPSDAPADPDLDRAAEPGPVTPDSGGAPETAPEPAADPEPESEPAAPGAEPEPPDGDLDRAAEPAPPAGSAEPEPEATPEADVADVAADASEAADAADEEATPPAAVGPRTVGRLIADALRAAGVRYAFTVPGESFLGLLDGLRDAGIRVVATRHEGGAAFMAEAYGQLTGRPAACVGTRAVGAANLAIGIHTARQNSTPMFALVGQVQRAFRGREAFQEVDQVESFGRLAKWSAEPRTAAEVPGVVSTAVEAALGGRPGPVLLSLPEDLLDEVVPADEAPVVARPPLPRADVPDVRAVLLMLASAERPVILAGGGVLRARTSSDLTRLAELLHVPVIAGWRRGDAFSNDHPLFLGMAGYGSPRIVRERLEAADALLVVGCRLSEITSFGYTVPRDGQRWAHVDLEPHTAATAAAAGLPAPDLAIRSDARSFLRGSVQRLRGAVLHAGLVDIRKANNESDRRAWEAAATVDEGDWDGPGVHPGRVIATLRRVLPDEAIITTDAGNFGGWAARGFRFRRPGTFLGPTSGAMGYGLPAGIAAALVHRDRPVVALTGDGGLAMTMAELETAVRENARVVVLAFDNERYGTIRMHQEARDSGEPIATDLGPIDFTAVARACGARGTRVETDDAFEGALRQALAADRPTVIQLTLDRRWLSVDDPAVR